MGKVIDFDPRDFKADKSCENNVIAKYFVTDKDGENVIAYSIGNWNWDWTQICCDKNLRKYRLCFQICDSRRLLQYVQ